LQLFVKAGARGDQTCDVAPSIGWDSRSKHCELQILLPTHSYQNMVGKTLSLSLFSVFDCRSTWYLSSYSVYVN